MYRGDLPLRGFDQECRAQVAENLAGRGIKVLREGGKEAAELHEPPCKQAQPSRHVRFTYLQRLHRCFCRQSTNHMSRQQLAWFKMSRTD